MKYRGELSDRMLAGQIPVTAEELSVVITGTIGHTKQCCVLIDARVFGAHP
jgi:hypothetical protein